MTLWQCTSTGLDTHTNHRKQGLHTYAYGYTHSRQRVGSAWGSHRAAGAGGVPCARGDSSCNSRYSQPRQRSGIYASSGSAGGYTEPTGRAEDVAGGSMLGTRRITGNSHGN
jgi:hypothetical protein